MIGIPVQSNSIYISPLQTGCCKAEFDSTYPIHLNGIISQEEFHQSINRINRAVSSTSAMFVLGILFIVTIIGGTICFIVGGITAANSHRMGFPALIGVGIGLTMVGSLLFAFGCVFIQYKRLAQLRQIIGEESSKYSSRSPTPCSWRLETSRTLMSSYRYNNRNQIVYHIVIDIGRSNPLGSDAVYPPNSMSADPNIFSARQQNYGPPPYPGQSAEACVQCGHPRADYNARFCSSCGYAFHKY